MKDIITFITIVLSLISVTGFRAPQDDFPILKGPYLGQKPPGKTPEPFAPEVLNSQRYLWHHSVIIFSPDGHEAIWNGALPQKTTEEKNFEGLFTSRRINNQWTEPRLFPFLGGNGDSAAMTPDGNKLYFLSTQPVPGEDVTIRKENIWVSERARDEWSEPHPLPQRVNSLPMHWQISLNDRGDLYFGAWKVDPVSGRTLEHDIYVSRLEKGQFTVPEKLGNAINHPHFKQYSPHISPEGDYLIFTRVPKKPPYRTTMHVSYQHKPGDWSPPLDISPYLKISGGNAKVTADGKYLFFLREGREIYWVDASFIEELRPKK
jgi:hypothetical protein